MNLINNILSLLLLGWLVGNKCGLVVRGERVEILMSNITTQNEDAYMCTSYRLEDDQQYITNIQPLTNANIAHHMFAFGCEKPASSSNSWNCETNVCQGPKSILFAWGRNAPSLQLPDDVAFKVGPKTNYKYIVVNIHYLKTVSNDKSGLAITVSDRPRRYQAGIMLLLSGSIAIPPKAEKYSSKFSCKYTGRTLQVFAFRVHAHSHGDANTAYRVRDHEWSLLGRGDPQWPQAFYPTDSLYDVKEGDALVGQCTYHNDESRYVYAGSTHTDEMCNVYLMYYTDGSVDDVMEVCAGNTYPQLEDVIPAIAQQRPPPPASFTQQQGGGSGGSSSSNPMSHHDMEGSKIHSNNDNSKKQPSSSSSLAYLLGQTGLAAGGGGAVGGGGASDDYYDQIESSRGRSRQKDLLDLQSQDDLQSLFDPNPLVDLENSNDDYASSLLSSSDSASQLLLAAELANKLKKKSGFGDSAIKANKIKSQLNNLTPQTVTITKYTLIDKWYDPAQVTMGQIGGVAVDQKTNTVTVFHRGSQIWETDSFNRDYEFNTRKYTQIPVNTIVTMNLDTGKVVKTFGANMFYMPHGLKIDGEGNIWVTDVGRHQVLKFAPNNTDKPILVVGEAMVPGNDKKHFCQPADVAILKNGDFFVADGYCNSRIVKFSRTGDFLGEWSSEDEGMPAHFFVPHSLALHEKQNLLCVADRENYRVQCFDLNGNSVHQTSMQDYGPVYGVDFGANNGSVLYAINGYNSRMNTQYEKKIFVVSTKTGEIVASIPLNPDIRTPHSLSVNDDATTIIIGNLNPPAVFKYMLLNYNFGKGGGNKTTSSSKLGVSDLDKQNFRTSLFIMAFLVVPIVLVIVGAVLARLKHMGKLKGKLGKLVVDKAKQKDLGKWMSKRTGGGGASSKNRKGFTRLRQDSEDEEAEQLTKESKPSSSNGGIDNSDYEESNSEAEITLPPITKA